jgi:diguanylate cyclase (GGDEF)-like protein
VNTNAPKKPVDSAPSFPSHIEASSASQRAVESDAAELLYRHGIGSVLVSLFASSGLAFISIGQVSSTLLFLWWMSMSIVLVMRGIDILHFHRFRSSRRPTGRREIRRFGAGVIAAAGLWAAFPILMLKGLHQTGRAYMMIVLCGMVGGSATVLAPSKTLSLIFCALLVLPTSTLFLFLPGAQNTFLGALGYIYFFVMIISSRVANRATMTAIRLSRANEALVAGMEDERSRTEATNIQLKGAQIALSEANQSLEYRIRMRTADLEKEMNEKERYAKKLAHLASTDSLTGLCNRAALKERLGAALARAHHSGQGLAVLFLDLDKFKEVNDFLGHMAGDHVLQVVAQRLSQNVPSGVELARWGGDEFVIALPGVASSDEAIALARLLGTCLSGPIEIEAGVARVDVTIGVALFPDHGRTEEQLIRAADVAMYAGKEERSSKIRLFDTPLDRRLKERHILEYALREAIDAEALSVVFQPIITVCSGACETLEALARWNHPQRGPISPRDFIPLAERTGEIVALGRWMLFRACREAASWPGDPPPSVSINASVLQIKAGTLTTDILEALSESELPASRLQIEITESVFAGDHREIISTLTKLREKGVRISLDDFGTGFSCLADLRGLPIDQIKIDKSFVESLDIDWVPIVKVIVTTAQTFGLQVVAEGVETKEQAERLIGLGAHYLQGYLFSNCLTPEATREWLLTHHLTVTV